ncbi:sialate O-acetylesterase [Arcticibacterium luteifluviistationis]|uniref:Sialate O-acetylesterase n=1 Tax=Arcticibacterium luteifluviistationis TaxID=1784714 RepID=A0A2Z4GE35_9BACT|nr:sialate O-acetylesterase [Arcticibacterium luteifluviistationis]AWV99420.1 sialate O-acetylesterase [Arcticibacterium luteifluviistationis]
MTKKRIIPLFLSLLFAFQANAQIKLPSIFGDHMVLQQKQNNPVWGWAKPNEKITIAINGQSHSTTADSKGHWRVVLRPIPVGGPYKMHIEGEASKFFFEDVLVGEVWICSGQSNMQWSLKNTNSAELALATANYPNIRLITVPTVAASEPQDDFNGSWEAASPESVPDFSAIGYFFGQRLHHALDVPIGLIDNAWGGSAAEAWVNRDVLEADKNFNEFMTSWEKIEQAYNYDAEIKKWEKSVKEWEANKEDKGMPRKPGNLIKGNQYPANIYNGVLHPTIGYGIKGVIWYQGESNAGRSYQYRDLFPLMIENWRNEWKQGDFPFYYVQLADFMAETEQPQESGWAELREAQTMTKDRLPNVGEAVIIDLGEGRDIHPRSKQTVADRLVRIALARDYHKDIIYEGPNYKSMEVKGDKILLTFDNVGKGLYSFDTKEPVGFAIAGSDKKFVWADAKIISNNQMEISGEGISTPVAVRYAWANNPVCNMYNRDGLPMTPFRTDSWEGVTYGKNVR